MIFAFCNSFDIRGLKLRRTPFSHLTSFLYQSANTESDSLKEIDCEVVDGASGLSLVIIRLRHSAISMRWTGLATPTALDGVGLDKVGTVPASRSRITLAVPSSPSA